MSHHEECCSREMHHHHGECCSKEAHHYEQEECCNMPEQLLELADEAWMEVLKEKIKKEIEVTSGEKLNHLAKLIAETNGAKWRAKMSEKKHCQEYKQKLLQFFSEK